MDLVGSARKNHTAECVECGKCSYACPAAHRDNRFSPRRVMEDFMAGKELDRWEIWSCMSCGACSDLCTSGVTFHEFIRDVRADINSQFPPIQTHNGILREMRRTEAAGRTKGHRPDWVTPDLELDPDSDTALFVGCTPLFDQLFNGFAKDMLEIPRSAVRLLNAMGIRPKLVDEELCCGHDSHWLGEDETFARLARLTAERLRRTRAKRVVTFCPECHHTLSQVYPGVVPGFDIEIVNLAELVGKAVEEGRLELDPDGERYTFHDPCKLVRFAKVVDEPRAVIEACGELKEMPRSGTSSACCGNPCWANCDDDTKRWQVDRLTEARETGAEALVTACPKCYVHLSCAQKDYGTHRDRPRIPLIDLHVLAASRLVKGDKKG
jgi:heterodisulfide reductase subunit D